MTEVPSYPSANSEYVGPSPEFIWVRTEKALGDSTEALHKIAIHERECAMRFLEVRNELTLQRFWMKLGTVTLMVLVMAVFLHLDIAHIVKLISPINLLP